MTKEMNTRLLVKTSELVELANAATDSRNFHEGMLMATMEVVNVHGTLTMSWRVCLGSFCSEGTNATVDDAMDSLERVIKEAGGQG